MTNVCVSHMYIDLKHNIFTKKKLYVISMQLAYVYMYIYRFEHFGVENRCEHKITYFAIPFL